MKINSVNYLFAAMLMAGCAVSVDKVPVPTGGSKADGTVILSYNVAMLEQPVVDWSTADKSAIQRCGAWGYQKADRFEGAQTVCQVRNGYGNCLEAVVNITYQCTN